MFFYQWRYAKLAVTANEYLKVVSIVVTTENFGKIKNSVMILNKLCYLTVNEEIVSIKNFLWDMKVSTTKKNVLFWVLFRHGSCSHGQYKNLSS